MLIHIVLILLGAPFTLSSPVPAPEYLGAPQTATYASVVASGGKIFTPSTKDIIPPIGTPARYKAQRIRTTSEPAVQLAGSLCDTTTSSPVYGDAMKLVLYFFNLDNSWCCQVNPGKSCTAMASYMTATVAVCGQQGQCYRCGFAGLASESIIKKCRWIDQFRVERAGGKYTWDINGEFVIYHAYKGFNG